MLKWDLTLVEDDSASGAKASAARGEAGCACMRAEVDHRRRIPPAGLRRVVASGRSRSGFSKWERERNGEGGGVVAGLKTGERAGEGATGRQVPPSPVHGVHGARGS
jgi:hypothetical protein